MSNENRPDETIPVEKQLLEKKKKEDNRTDFTEEDKIANMRMKMQYGGREVEETVRVVREEMNLSVDDMEVEVSRRLREKHDQEEKKSADEIVEKAKADRETAIREKAEEAKEEVKRKENEREDEKKG